MKREIDYLSLAKQARLDGKPDMVWFYFKQHARVRRKIWGNKKAAFTDAAR